MLPLPYSARHTSSTSLYVTFPFDLILKQLPIAFSEFEEYGKNISSKAQGPKIEKSMTNTNSKQMPEKIQFNVYGISMYKFPYQDYQ